MSVKWKSRDLSISDLYISIVNVYYQCLSSFLSSNQRLLDRSYLIRQYRREMLAIVKYVN